MIEIPCSPDDISYTLSNTANGKCLTFYPCGFKTYHERDIAERYCARCHRFMDLLDLARMLKAKWM